MLDAGIDSQHAIGAFTRYVEDAGVALGAAHSQYAREAAVRGLAGIHVDDPRSDAPMSQVWSGKRKDGHRLERVEVGGRSGRVGHDESGRVIEAFDTEMFYGPRGRLIAAENGDGEVEQYLYDARGKMAARIADGGDIETFTWDGPQIAAAFDGAGAPKWEAVWGPGMDRVVEWRDFSSNETFTPMTDHRRSVVGTWSNERMAVDQIGSYNAHGRLELKDAAENTLCDEKGTADTVCDNPSGMPFGFLSALRSETTGLVYLRNRWYSPRLGQFTSHDPMGYVDSYNPYAYVAMDPVNGWDPWGLENQDFASRAASGAADGLEKQAKSAADNVSNCVMNPLDCAKETAKGLKEQARDLEETYKDEGTEGVVDSLIPMNEWQRDYRRALTRYSNGDPEGANEFGEVMSEGWQVSPGGIYRKSLYRPDRPLPRNKDGVSTPDTDVPHTQLGNRKGGNGEYRQSREWTEDEDGNLVKKKDIDWTDHGRPQEHANPHKHRWEKNETGGSLKRGDGEPLDDE